MLGTGDESLWTFGVAHAGDSTVPSEDVNDSESCNLSRPDFYTADDFDRVLRVLDEFAISIGVEDHEADHVLGLGHTQDCSAVWVVVSLRVGFTTGGL